MVSLNPDWLNFIVPFTNDSPYFKHESMKIISIKYGESILEIKVEKKHHQVYGTVHGGVYGAIIDAAGWWAVFSKIKGNLSASTAEMKLNYLASASSGKLIAYGKCIKLGKTLGLGESTVKNENGKFLAHGTVTVIIRPPYEFSGIDEIPPKFID